MADIVNTKKRIKEKANLDVKTKAVFDKKGYEVLDKISEGAFGKVFTSINRRKGEMAAVKVMDLDKCDKKFTEKFLPRELAMLIQIRHPYVVGVFDIFKANNKIYIFMEYCPNGTLADWVKKNGPCPETETKFWFKQCADALHHMHATLQICHRDIKVENILLDANNNAKLSDFGFARGVVVDGQVELSGTYCGTEPYYCPELVRKRDLRGRYVLQYDPFKADTWAMGVTLFALLNNKFPFHYDKRMLEEQTTNNYVYRPTVEHLLSKIVKDLVRKLLEVNQERRLDSSQLVRHAWFST